MTAAWPVIITNALTLLLALSILALKVASLRQSALSGDLPV